MCEAICVKFVKRLSAQVFSVKHALTWRAGVFGYKHGAQRAHSSGTNTDMFEVIHYRMVDIPPHIYLSDAIQTIK